MRSGALQGKPEFNFDKKRNTSKSEIKKLKGNAHFENKVSKRYNKYGIVGKNIKLRSNSKLTKKYDDGASNNSRSTQKSRIKSSTSKSRRSATKGGINMKEFSKLKFENQRFRHLLGEMANKFTRFKKIMAKKGGKSSESGSSMVLEVDSRKSSTKRKYPQDQVQFNTADLKKNDNRDGIILKLKQKVSDQNDIILKLKRENERLRNKT